jgi:protein TonB
VTGIGAEADRAMLLPRKLRVQLASLSCVAHLALIAAFSVVAQQVSVLAPLNIDLVPQGDYIVDTVAVAGAAAAETAEQHQTQAPVEKNQETADEAPQAMAQQETPSPQLAQDRPEEQAPPPVLEQRVEAPTADLAMQDAKRQLEAQERAEATEKARERQRAIDRKKRALERLHREMRQRRDELRDARNSNRGGSEGHRAGVAQGQSLRAARYNYGAIVSAELNRHKIYPAAARSRGESGSVGVTFTVGPSGGISSYSLYAPSGSAALDGAVKAMFAAARAPPPPDGVFHGRITINFSFSQ